MSTVRVRHLLIKHQESRNPISRRTNEPTTGKTKAQAEEVLRRHGMSAGQSGGLASKDEAAEDAGDDIELAEEASEGGSGDDAKAPAPDLPEAARKKKRRRKVSTTEDDTDGAHVTDDLPEATPSVEHFSKSGAHASRAAVPRPHLRIRTRTCWPRARAAGNSRRCSL